MSTDTTNVKTMNISRCLFQVYVEVCYAYQRELRGTPRENRTWPVATTYRRYPIRHYSTVNTFKFRLAWHMIIKSKTLWESKSWYSTAGIGLHVNAHKTEYMCYNQTGNIATLDGASLKLVDKFTYLGSSVSSTEKDIDTRLTKAWTAIDRLSIIWKSDLTDKMKRSFFQAAVVSILLYGCTTWTLTKRLEKKTRRKLH